MLKESPTKYVVGFFIACPMFYFSYILAGPWFGTLFLLMLLYEGYTLINQFPDDTISEIMWQYSKRPMVPCMFGYALGRAIGTDLLSKVDLAVIIGFLYGHFFFQRQDS